MLFGNAEDHSVSAGIIEDIRTWVVNSANGSIVDGDLIKVKGEHRNEGGNE